MAKKKTKTGSKSKSTKTKTKAKPKKKKIHEGMKVGETKTITRMVKGEKRVLTYERVRAHGKNRNLKVKLVKNVPAPDSKGLNVAQAKKIHAKRSKKAREMDEKSTAKEVTTGKKWQRHPERYDYPSVDTKKKKK